MPEDEYVEEAVEPVKGKKQKTETKPAKPAEKTVAVKVVASKDGSALVEWSVNDDLRRCYVPAKEVGKGGQTAEGTLKAGIPYGVNWDDALADLPGVMASTIAMELRRRGIWTLKDLDRTRDVQTAIRRGFGNIFSMLRSAAKEEA